MGCFDIEWFITSYLIRSLEANQIMVYERLFKCLTHLISCIENFRCWKGYKVQFAMHLSLWKVFFKIWCNLQIWRSTLYIIVRNLAFPRILQQITCIVIIFYVFYWVDSTKESLYVFQRCCHQIMLGDFLLYLDMK